jgi:hypothetical protein
MRLQKNSCSRIFSDVSDPANGVRTNIGYVSVSTLILTGRYSDNKPVATSYRH